MEDVIIKASGHCYDGYGWRECPFWYHLDSLKRSMCTLFGGLEGVSKDASKALVICDKIYGRDYEGNV